MLPFGARSGVTQGFANALVLLLKLAVNHVPGSGKGAELLHDQGIDADGIAAAARRLVGLGSQLAAAGAA